MIRRLHIILLGFVTILIVACNSNRNSYPFIEVNRDLDSLEAKGKIIALIDNSSTSYFIYKGQPMGFEYELLKRFCDDVGLQLEVRLIKDMGNADRLLNSGYGDIIAANLAVTKPYSETINFTDYHTVSRQVLIQRTPSDWRQLKDYEIDRQLVKRPLDLAGKEVYVHKNSAFSERLRNLSDEIGAEIIIKEVPGDISTEQLIAQVSQEDIDYTIASENVAFINSVYYGNIDVNTAISFSQKIAWGVRYNSPELKERINDWLKEFRKTRDFNVIYNKYFVNHRMYSKRINSQLYAARTGIISLYDDHIKQYSKELGWDWRLLASLIYQESNFNPNAKSWTGAYGLMQLMPKTAEAYGLSAQGSPRENIAAGVKHLKWLNRYWSRYIEDPEEKVKFVIASYNVGHGHIRDARQLAYKYSHNQNKWDDNVADFLLKKSSPKYYQDEVVKYGYCRGNEPFSYVEQILNRYEHYKNITDSAQPKLSETLADL